MSLIMPRDTIEITIDNTRNPPSLEMKCSRDMPAPYVAMLLGQLIASLMSQVMTQIIPPLPDLGQKPFPGTTGEQS